MSKILRYGHHKWPIVSTITFSYKRKDYVNRLKSIAGHAGAVSLSSVQISGELYSIFVIHTQLDQDMWKNYATRQCFYRAYANPLVSSCSATTATAWEHCPSYPNLRFLVERPTHITVHYENEQEQLIDEDLQHFHARVFMHEMHHLQDKDILKHCLDLEIVDRRIKDVKGEHIKKLFQEYHQERKRKQQQNKEYKQLPTFIQLRREIVYNVVEK